MFIGREKELLYLNECYEKTENRILVLYGQKGIGKTTLLKHFMEEKEGLYYEALSCSARQQRVFLASYLKDIGISVSGENGFEEIFSAIEEKGRKKLLVIDEFQNLCKTNNEFWEAVDAYCNHRGEESNLFFILSSSSVGWVENSKKEKLGDFISESPVFFKIKELEYLDFKEYFPLFSREDSVGGYGILGGIPGLWKCFDDKFSLRENIERFILQREEKLFEYGQQYVAEELRETAVYNTILGALASGKQKLNELYLFTGFSRAKISVYLKNLIELEIVEKLISVDTEGRENVRKGIYQIKSSYVHFYYQYIFPNQNRIGTWKTEEVFEKLIEPTISSYAAEGFKKVCQEFLEMESELGRLPEKFRYLGQWAGKKGDIDLVFKSEDEELLVGNCHWEKKMLSFEDYQFLLECQESAKIQAEYMILFSTGKFDNRLREEAKRNPYLALVSVEQIRGF